MPPSRRIWRTAAASAVVVLAVLGLVVVAFPAAAEPGDTILVLRNTTGIDVALLPYHPRPFTDHVLTTWGSGPNWASFQARLAEPFPEAPSQERCGRDWALARGSDVATGRPSWEETHG